MPILTKALKLWTESGHSQVEFSILTGIDRSVCSRLFSGERGLTLAQRASIFRAFHEKDLHQGLLLLRADLEDNIPAEARRYLRIILDEPTRTKDAGDKDNPIESAKRSLMKELDADDPDAVALALALYEWKEKR